MNVLGFLGFFFLVLWGLCLIVLFFTISYYSLLVDRVSFDRSAVKCMGFPLYVSFFFDIAAFNILSLSLYFVVLSTVCLNVFLFGAVLTEPFRNFGSGYLYPSTLRSFHL